MSYHNHILSYHIMSLINSCNWNVYISLNWMLT